jgi:energy-converting hydrogenase Eha subunit B
MYIQEPLVTLVVWTKFVCIDWAWGTPKKGGIRVLENMQQSSKNHEYENY